MFVAIIEHKHGHNVYVHTSEFGAIRAVADYCREWYESEVGISPAEYIEVDEPTDQQVIDTYFECVETESYFIELADLQP